jgi:hypothetical protein
MVRAILLTVVLLLSACMADYYKKYQGDVDSPYYLVPVGSTLVQNQDVVIPPNTASTYFQGGVTMPQSQVNQYHPFCKFEVLKVKDSAQTIKADTYVIKKVVQERTDSVDAGQIRLAALSDGMGTMVGGIYGTVTITLVTRMFLHSDKQPDVYGLSCGHWVYPSTGQHLTIHEMRTALGGVFTLQLASN